MRSARGRCRDGPGPAPAPRGRATEGRRPSARDGREYGRDFDLWAPRPGGPSASLRRPAGPSLRPAAVLCGERAGHPHVPTERGGGTRGTRYRPLPVVSVEGFYTGRSMSVSFLGSIPGAPLTLGLIPSRLFPLRRDWGSGCATHWNLLSEGERLVVGVTSRDFKLRRKILQENGGEGDGPPNH